jgi:hypothetical protein
MCNRLRVQGSRFRVQGSGFKGSGFKGSGFKVQGSRVQGSRVQGSRVQGSRFKGSGFKVQGFGSKSRLFWKLHSTGLFAKVLLEASLCLPVLRSSRPHFKRVLKFGHYE